VSANGRPNQTATVELLNEHSWETCWPSQELVEQWQQLPLIVLAGLR
jgi:hypothetical protein